MTPKFEPGDVICNPRGLKDKHGDYSVTYKVLEVQKTTTFDDCHRYNLRQVETGHILRDIAEYRISSFIILSDNYDTEV